MTTLPIGRPVYELVSFCVSVMGREPEVLADAAGVSLVFTPDLTAGELAVFNSLVRYSQANFDISPRAYVDLEPTLQSLRQYRNLASPTNAQTVAAVKGILDVLRGMLRDS